MAKTPLETHFSRLICAVVLSLLGVMGCSRTDYRLRADREAYELIAEKSFDPRWQVENVDIAPDPRSRFYDPYDPDESPIPRDDPASAIYMERVDGKRGWKHWYDNGEREALENPLWREELESYSEMTDEGAVKIDIDSALDLAYLHSSFHQQQLETLYLIALDVSAERFRLGSQYLGGYNLNYRHQGSLRPSSLGYNPTLGRYVIVPALDGVESNLMTVGRGSLGSPAFQTSRRFATAGEVLVGFANSFVFEFTGGNASLTSSLASLSFVQPLLRQAGRDIALEQLTRSERNLLAGLRSYAQFRQGFYSQIVVGDLGVSGVQQGGTGTAIQSFSGGGFVGGYLGLLQQVQQIRNTRENLNFQEEILEQLTALYEVGIIDLVQVDQFNQSVELERSRLLQEQNGFALALDRYKTSTLGLPPDLLIRLNDDLIQPFQLIDAEATELQAAIKAQKDRVSQFPDDASLEQVLVLLESMRPLFERSALQLDAARLDIQRMDQNLLERQPKMSQEEIQELDDVRTRMTKNILDIDQKFMAAGNELGMLIQNVNDANRVKTVRSAVAWTSNLLRLIEQLVLVQARARLEAIDVDKLEVPPALAYRVALENRLDFMNGRAALVDQWRRIQIQANTLQSAVNITGSTDVRTASNNPVDFRAATANARLGLEFDAPLTRLLERNNYRQSLIQYQQSRRRLIQSRDGLNLGVRALLRNIELLQKNLEIRRRSVAIAIRQVDLTRASLYAPVRPPAPGQRAVPFGPTAARDLIRALSALRDSQNSLLATYLDYYSAKLTLARELGIMQLDDDGRWINQSFEVLPLPDAEGTDGSSDETLPPPVPEEMLELSRQIDHREAYDAASLYAPAGTFSPGPPPSIRMEGVQMAGERGANAENY
ncbi:MAG: TolC family protein [Planctomycetota bacterium]|nr:TolC family protein [Planctomycetota bacterium]